MRSIQFTILCLFLALTINEIVALSNEAVQIVDKDDQAPKLWCDGAVCANECQQKGYSSGYCDHSGCKCIIKMVAAADGNDEHQPEGRPVQLRCNAKRCNKSCISKGHQKGSCEKNVCVCSDARAYNVQPKQEQVNIVPKMGFCLSFRCNSFCRDSGHSGGYCVNSNTCKCNLFRKLIEVTDKEVDESIKPVKSTEENTEIEPKAAKAVCSNSNCNASCRRKGDHRGYCEDGVCKCLSFCLSFRCDSYCRQSGHSGGYCVDSNTCKCNLFRKLIEVTDKEVDESIKPVKSTEEKPEIESKVAKAVCSDGNCNASCRRKGDPSGYCEDGICKCRKYARNVEQLVGNEVEESPVKPVLPIEVANVEANEPEALPAPRFNCIEFFCNSNCLAWGHKSGYCENQWTCKCRD